MPAYGRFEEHWAPVPRSSSELLAPKVSFKSNQNNIQQNQIKNSSISAPPTIQSEINKANNFENSSLIREHTKIKVYSGRGHGPCRRVEQ